MKSKVEATSYPLGSVLEFLQLLWQTNHALEKLSSQMERRLGITAQQRLTIRCVGKYPGIAAGQLATLLRVDPGTVSVSLKRLEEKGLLERRTDPRDARRALLGLTAKGRRLDGPAEHSVERAVERLFGAASERDIATVVRVLGELATMLQDEYCGQ